ncbi:hypothetical protein RGQ29_025008 [Quercus rubra]|uniref:DUF659 domain-containing protein n=1 Tax=Quercus rubra TaxID=3512 RepID=A0AAN7IPK3_QUERU|nr:hypothetical protein RGQ29_025008 [Quercus rubra]
MVSDNGRRKDPGWEYNYLANVEDKNAVTCLFCNKVTKGGIHRAKQHQVGNFKNSTKCLKCPDHVREELAQYMAEKKSEKENYDKMLDFDDIDNMIEIEDVDDDEVEEVEVIQKGKKSCSSKRGLKGPMDSFIRLKPEKVVALRKQGKMKQTNINDKLDKEKRAQACQYIGRLFYLAGIPFNVARLDEFKWAIEAIGQYGPNMKPPSYHELKVPILKKEVAYTNELLSDHKQDWKKYGCSIMSDGWTSRTNRTLINFLVNCPSGTMFVKSIDASSFMKTGEKTFELLDTFVEQIGEANLLEAKRPNLYWTPCAAHCIDLILEDIGKIPRIAKTLERVIQLTGYIYNHGGVLNMMREYTKQRELVRAGKTRFCTSYLIIKSIYKQKHNLRAMFTSEEWVRSRWAKEANAKRVVEMILMPSFWNTIVYILKVMGPLVRVLRLVDNERKPAMGYIYGAMDRAKEAIIKAFNENEERYSNIFKIIDERWECQLHRPLNAAGHFLNPEYFYFDDNIATNHEITAGLYACIQRLVPTVEIQDKIMAELPIYKKAEGLFGIELAKRSRKTRAPTIRILSLTCSACGCEYNWSVFEQIHTKRRNRLAQKRLNDLVFVKYNQKMKARYDKRDVIDPISLDDIDESNEWLLGEMGAEPSMNVEDELVFDDDDDGLTWGVVARAVGVGEPRKNTRFQTKSRASSKASTSQPNIEEEDADSDETEEENVDGYKSGSSGFESDGNLSEDSDDDL